MLTWKRYYIWIPKQSCEYGCINVFPMIFKKLLIILSSLKKKKLNGYLLLLTCIDCRKEFGCFLSVDTFILSHYHYSLEHTFNISKITPIATITM